MTIRIVSLIVFTQVLTLSSQMISKSTVSGLEFRLNTFSRDSSSRYGTGSVERAGSPGSVLEEDAIFDLKPEGPSHRAMTWAWWPDESLRSLRYADHRVTWSLPDYIWPWALAQTIVFSKFNTEINYKLNYSRTVMLFFFQRIKACGMVCWKC